MIFSLVKSPVLHIYPPTYRRIDMTNVTVSPSGEAGHTNEFEIK